MEKNNKIVTLEMVKNCKEVSVLMKYAENQLAVMGYTEHGTRHVCITVKRLTDILTKIGASKREVELGQIAAYMHDIGNCVNRDGHPETGAVLTYNILLKLGMDEDEAAQILSAIGNHDEKAGKPVSKISAALILADKSDVHRSRVRKNRIDAIKQKLVDGADIHDRVNFAVEKSELVVCPKTSEILFELVIDTEISSAMDYFDIFLERMRMCKSAAQYLGYQFKMSVNDYRLV